METVEVVDLEVAQNNLTEENQFGNLKAVYGITGEKIPVTCGEKPHAWLCRLCFVSIMNFKDELLKQNRTMIFMLLGLRVSTWIRPSRYHRWRQKQRGKWWKTRIKPFALAASVLLLFVAGAQAAEHDTGLTSISTDSVRILNKRDYERLKELQYINAFKAILDSPDSLYVVRSTEIPTGWDRYDVIRRRIINWILTEDPYDFFEDTYGLRESLKNQSAPTHAP